LSEVDDDPVEMVGAGAVCASTGRKAAPTKSMVAASTAAMNVVLMIERMGAMLINERRLRVVKIL
jgi:hypothetical protein